MATWKLVFQLKRDIYWHSLYACLIIDVTVMFMSMKTCYFLVLRKYTLCTVIKELGLGQLSDICNGETYVLGMTNLVIVIHNKCSFFSLLCCCYYVMSIY